MLISELFESQQIHNRAKLDAVLARCVKLVHEKNSENPNKYGRVAACIIDSKNRMVFAVSFAGKNGWHHAERAALDKYHKAHGKVPPGSIMVTTLSPCNRGMPDRDGPSCQDLISQAGIKKVYTGYMDPTQHSDHPYAEEVTTNDDIWEACKALSDSFVHQGDLYESEDQQDAAGIVLYAQDTGRWGLQQRSDNINDPGLWSAWGGGREPGETLEQTARRELAEEGGYTGPIRLYPLGKNAKYVTYIGIVPHEFTPRANPEWKDYCWVEFGQWPAPMHPGTAAALKNIPMNENFADGKHPGRKGLAKRVGVNCKQSISKLRDVAAHSTGERQRMAHWCANMKSGKKK